MLTEALQKYLPKSLLGRPMLFLLLPFAAGIVLAFFLRPGLKAAALILFCVLIAAILITRLLKDKKPCALLISFALGIFLCAGQYAYLAAFTADGGDEVLVEGKVLSAATDMGEGRYRLKLRPLSINGEKINSSPIYVYAEGHAPRPGSFLEVRGEVFSPQPRGNANAFDYNLYLQRQGLAGSVSAYFGGEVRVIKDGPLFHVSSLGSWLRYSLEQSAKNLSSRQKSLVFGVFIGEKSGLDYAANQVLGLTGLLDAFAVSGLHVSFIISIALLLAGSGFKRRLPRLLLTIFLLLIYISLTGASASVLRSAMMAVLLLLGQAFMEKTDSINTVAFAALICLFIHPLWLFDAGFQLSFAAVLGVIIFTPTFDRLLKSWPKLVRKSYAVALAGTISIMPLVCYYFYHISWLGWIITPLAALAVGAVVILSFIALVLSLFFPWLAGIFLLLGGHIMELLYALAAKMAALPGVASVTGAVPAWVVAIFYILALAMLGLSRLRNGAKRIIICLLMLTFTFSLAPAVFGSGGIGGEKTDIAEIIFLDVGQGDAALIMTRDGKTLLIDGGGSMKSGAMGEYTLLPYLKSRGIDRIDLIISSHPDNDHIDGLLFALEHMPVSYVLYGDCWPDEPLQQKFLDTATKNGANLMPVQAGEGFQVGKYLHIKVYHPATEIVSGLALSDNDASLICEISCGNIDFLFTGDAGGSVLAGLVRDFDIEAEIVKLPHHGSRTGYDEVFYEGVRAETAIISVGANNSYGHPVGKVVEYWQETGTVFRTDMHGAITIYTDGQNYRVTTEKN